MRGKFFHFVLLSDGIMKAFLVLCLVAVAVAKPKGLPKVGFNQNRIIGGHEAEPRKFDNFEALFKILFKK